MIKKSYSKTAQACRAPFKLPSEVEAGTAYVIGGHNHWDAGGYIATEFCSEDARVEV